MGLYSIRVGPNAVTGNLRRGGKFGHRGRTQEECRVKMETEMGVMWPPARKHQGVMKPPEGRREAWHRVSLEPTLPTHLFQTSCLPKSETTGFWYFKPPRLQYFLLEALGSNKSTKPFQNQAP